MALSLNGRTLADFGTTPSPWLRLGFASLWLILFWGAALALWRRRPIIRRAVPLLLSVYALYELGLLIFYAQAATVRQNWRVNTLFYGLIIVFSWWALNRTAVKPYFME